MAVLMPSRLTVALFTALLCALSPAPALAHHHRDQWDGEVPTQAPADGDWVPPEDGVTPEPEPAQPVVPPAFAAPAPAPAPPAIPVLPEIAPTKLVPGTVARLRTDGKAAIPRGAPKRVRALIASANQIVGKPYKWGGGHARIADTGYDCSGTVSYALIGSGLLAGPLVSGSFAHWSEAGDGRWVTVYANKGHVYLEAAGLRLDTSAVGDPRGGSGPRWRPLIGRRRGFSVRHPAGL
jgi:cell wall-associated NlpC family hydrolase